MYVKAVLYIAWQILSFCGRSPSAAASSSQNFLGHLRCLGDLGRIYGGVPLSWALLVCPVWDGPPTMCPHGVQGTPGSLAQSAVPAPPSGAGEGLSPRAGAGTGGALMWGFSQKNPWELGQKCVGRYLYVAQSPSRFQLCMCTSTPHVHSCPVHTCSTGMLTPTQTLSPCSRTLRTLALHPVHSFTLHAHSPLRHAAAACMCAYTHLTPPHLARVLTPCPHTLPRTPARALHTHILVHAHSCLPGTTTLPQPPNSPLPTPVTPRTPHPVLHPICTPNLARPARCRPRHVSAPPTSLQTPLPVPSLLLHSSPIHPSIRPPPHPSIRPSA